MHLVTENNVNYAMKVVNIVRAREVDLERSNGKTKNTGDTMDRLQEEHDVNI